MHGGIVLEAKQPESEFAVAGHATVRAVVSTGNTTWC